MVDDGHGATRGRFTVPTLIGEMLRTALSAIANPARPDPVPRVAGDGSRRPTPAVLGDAFVQYVERFPVDRLPPTGGVNPTVVVTVPLATLEGRLGAADLLGSHHQSADAHQWRQRWTDGGRTDLADLVLLCRRHHTLTHLPGRTLPRSPSGRYRIRRT